MTFSIKGSHPDVNNHVVKLNIVQGSMIEPAPMTKSYGSAWELMGGTVRHVFPGAIVAPSGMIGELLFHLPFSLQLANIRFPSI